ncbi:DUF4258 domain-containing protein [Aureivirga marina]|uniref:DUF4258 domain-containing protein n=1 Tax=Aureivirga marina TaxID=1182451 RepID=UPI0018CAE68B|nr:DUF4258 domain-containing protein [Aureivirga marina]
MNLFKRLTYFGGGLLMGIFFLFFFLNGKKASCDYLPNDRVLKNIRTKKLHYSEDAQKEMSTLQLDTLDIKTILTNGDVDFGRSNTKSKPCRKYIISGMTNSEKELELTIKNCEEEAMVETIIPIATK